jgi:hypothetical protein
LLAQDYPGCWRRLDELRHDVRAQGVTWPEWCWLPLAGAYALVSDGKSLDPARASDVARVGALATWRLTQGIYRLDETLLDELWGSELEGAIPTTVLEHLPEWCVYVETPGRELLGQRLHGYWAHLESDANSGRVELRLLLDQDSGPVGVPLHLGRGTGTLAEAGLGMLGEAAANAALHLHPLDAQLVASVDARALAETMRPLVSVLLYLATTAEALRTADGRIPERPAPRPGRRGEPPRYYPPAAPAVFPLGGALGAALRAAREVGRAEGEGSKRRGHVRRAHWHTYLLGPREGVQRREVRWLPPILVALEREDVAPVLRQVT